MFRSFSSVGSRSRRGVVAVVVALCLTVLVGVIAIVIDGGLLQDDRRSVQAAADAAALAAADDLYLNYPTKNGLDSGGSAAKAAYSTATANGFTNDHAVATVTVNIPPASGKFTGQAGYAEVIITYNQPRYFSNIFGVGAVPVSARAVARGQWVPQNNGVIVLDPTASGSLSANGNGDTFVKNSSIIVDSNSSTAATTVGNSYVADPNRPIDITGANPGYSGSFQGTVWTGQPAVPDPLAYLPAPDPNSLTTQTAGNGTTVNLLPGRYVGGLHFSGQQSVYMAPGIYYMDGGNFDFSGQGNLTAQGVMIYSTAGLSITGLGTVLLSPPTSGIYTGLSYFQSRTSTATAYIGGNGGYNVTGTFYSADGLVKLDGNGASSIASQVVSRFMTSGGNGATNIIWAGPPTARVRVLQLVE
jgi:hypothetical protein